MFPDDARTDRCGVRLFQLYQSKKPAAAMKGDFKFFLSAKVISKGRKWTDFDIWYTTTPMGIHTIGSLVSGQIKASSSDTNNVKITGTSVR